MLKRICSMMLVLSALTACNVDEENTNNAPAKAGYVDNFTGRWVYQNGSTFHLFECDKLPGVDYTISVAQSSVTFEKVFDDSFWSKNEIDGSLEFEFKVNADNTCLLSAGRQELDDYNNNINYLIVQQDASYCLSNGKISSYRSGTIATYVNNKSFPDYICKYEYHGTMTK